MKSLTPAPNCKRPYRQRRLAEFVCEWCGDRFSSRAAKPKYCTTSCKDRARYANRREERLTAARQYRACNADSIRSRRSELRRLNPERARQASRASYMRHRDRRIQDALAYQKANPDVVALTRNRRRTAEHLSVSRRDLRRLRSRYRGCCAYCGQPLAAWGRSQPNSLQWDHVVPLSKGGRHSVGNLVPSCRTCNLAKGCFLLSAWRHRLASTSKTEENQ